jgi:hypothetical protein
MKSVQVLMTDWGIIQSEGTKKRDKHRKLIEFSVEFLAFNNIFLLFGLVIAIFSLQKGGVDKFEYRVFKTAVRYF